MITALASSTTDIEGLAGVRSLAFNPERGTGQADIGSPYTLLAVVGVQVTACKSQRASHSVQVTVFFIITSSSADQTAPILQPVSSATEMMYNPMWILSAVLNSPSFSLRDMAFNLTVVTSNLRSSASPLRYRQRFGHSGQ